MKIQVFAGFAVLLLCYVEEVLSFPTGATLLVCVDGTPRNPHGPGQPLATSPYQLTSSAIPDGYIPGQTYTVTISKLNPSDPDFRGFLCQVRQVGQTTALGSFQPVDADKAQTLACTNPTGAITHTNRDQVAEQTFSWTAPEIGVGTEVQVVCTIVQSLATLWVHQRSVVFRELEFTTPSLSPTAMVPQTPPAERPTVEHVSVDLDDYKEYLVKWKEFDAYKERVETEECQ